MESMADGHLRSFIELLVGHLSDLRQKEQSRICLHTDLCTCAHENL